MFDVYIIYYVPTATTGYRLQSTFIIISCVYILNIKELTCNLIYEKLFFFLINSFGIRKNMYLNVIPTYPNMYIQRLSTY